METLLIAVGAGILYVAAYHTYGRWLSRKIFALNPEAPVPSRVMEDGKDYVPSRRSVVFGHHFTSIAGTGPIVGPAIAIIYGWVPALVWVLVGSIFMGAVHDLGAMIISMRHRGYSIGDLTGSLVSPRARTLFLLIIFFELLIVIAIFGLVIAAIFALFPQSVWPVWLQIPIAVALGVAVRRTGRHGVFVAGSLIALALMYVTMWLSASMPVTIPVLAGYPATFTWTVVLLIYAFIASILPVQWLLQPRDYINSNQLLAAGALLVLGLIAARPAMVAPAVQGSFDGIEQFPLFPFLFITIACGAISGFHCLVGSGTSSKQASCETDAKFIGYGSMLTEGFLAVLVILAVGAGLGMMYEARIPAGELAAFQAANPGVAVEGSAESGYGAAMSGAAAWKWHYRSWGAADAGLGPKVGAFVVGAANLMERLGLSHAFALAIMGVFVASFAGTTLDSATRLQRYVIAEAGRHSPGFGFLANRYVATGAAVVSAGVLALYDGKGAGAMILWPLFGAVNQLLAALALVAIAVYLYRQNKPVWMVVIPMVFMVTMTAVAMVYTIRSFLAADPRPWHNIILGVIILGLEIWLVIEAGLVWMKLRGMAPEHRALDTALATSEAVKSV